jgi:hypothetical protein
MLFAAVHWSAIGTKRTFAALQHFVRYWTRADMPNVSSERANLKR